MSLQALIERIRRSMKTDGVPLTTHDLAEIIRKLNYCEMQIEFIQDLEPSVLPSGHRLRRHKILEADAIARGENV